MTGPRGERRTRVALRALLLTIVVAGLPVGLLATVGGPWPNTGVFSQPVTEDAGQALSVPGSVLTEGVRVVGWCMALLVALPFFLEAWAIARCRTTHQIKALRPLHRFYGQELFRLHREYLGDTGLRPELVHEVLRQLTARYLGGSTLQEVGGGSPTGRSEEEPAFVPHLVEGEGRRADSLWALAEKYYGDGRLWTVVADANDIHPDTPLKKGMLLNIPILGASRRPPRSVVVGDHRSEVAE